MTLDDGLQRSSTARDAASETSQRYGQPARRLLIGETLYRYELKRLALIGAQCFHRPSNVSQLDNRALRLWAGKTYLCNLFVVFAIETSATSLTQKHVSQDCAGPRAHVRSYHELVMRFPSFEQSVLNEVVRHIPVMRERSRVSPKLGYHCRQVMSKRLQRQLLPNIIKEIIECGALRFYCGCRGHCV